MTPAQINARRMFVSGVMAERRLARVPLGSANKRTVVPFGTASHRKARRKMAHASRRRNRAA